jgi:broad specificity phosphatase PhoE
LILIHFFRHGQAGSRVHYDCLSDLGKEQAARLGEHLARERVQFDLSVCGGLRRQRETAGIVLRRLEEAGLSPRQQRQDPRWSEFDIDGIFAEIAPLLGADDPAFAAEWRSVQRAAADPTSRVHRHWTPADTRLVETWIAGRYRIAAETWDGFVGRVLEAGRELAGLPDGTRVAVFTSATPAAVWVSQVFGSVIPRRVMNMAGAQWNTAVSAIAWNGSGGPDLQCFNALPHIGEDCLRTFR